MATPSEAPSGEQSLTTILITALRFSDDLNRSLEQLRRENDSLKLQIERNSTVSLQPKLDITLENLRLENETLKAELASAQQVSQSSSQVGYLFKQNAEKQAEIDSLKSKLRVLQSQKRKWRLLHPDYSSSPIISSDEADRISLSSTPTGPAIIDCTNISPPENVASVRKRHRTQSPNPKSPLCEISLNIPEGGRDAKVQPKRRMRRPSLNGSNAIDAVAEDGEEHSLPAGLPVKVAVSPNPDVPAHQRLQNLLTAPPPTVQFLPRPSSGGTDSSARQAPQFLPIKVMVPSGPEDSEPFRVRPLRRQALSHFKLNPRCNDGFDYAFNEPVRNQGVRKCLPGCTKSGCCGDKSNAIAATLSRGTMGLSDDELLLEFLGKGSELKIRSLTPLARRNLIHEARAKKMTGAFVNIHRSSFHRPKTPPDFWGVDVLGSQEERNSHQQARLLERDEVEKRYQEALKENGRWLFADE